MGLQYSLNVLNRSVTIKISQWTPCSWWSMSAPSLVQHRPPSMRFYLRATIIYHYNVKPGSNIKQPHTASWPALNAAPILTPLNRLTVHIHKAYYTLGCLKLQSVLSEEHKNRIVTTIRDKMAFSWAAMLFAVSSQPERGYRGIKGKKKYFVASTPEGDVKPPLIGITRGLVITCCKAHHLGFRIYGEKGFIWVIPWG